MTLALLVCAATSHARAMYAWDYKELHRRADVVVIATPTAVRNLKERAPLPGMRASAAGGKPAPVIGEGVETDFHVEAVLAGSLPPGTSGSLTLHHYRVTRRGPMLNGPGLVAFDPAKPTQYLLFLIRQPDGRYMAVSGQTDPDQAIKALGLQAP